MSLNRHIADRVRLRTELNEALRERDNARRERDAGRRVVAELADRVGELTEQRNNYAEQYEQADTAHRAALADLVEAHRLISELQAHHYAGLAAVAPVLVAAEGVALAMHAEPDSDRG